MRDTNRGRDHALSELDRLGLLRRANRLDAQVEPTDGTRLFAIAAMLGRYDR